VVLLTLCCQGCARLPEFAQPHLSNQPFDRSLDYISYRQLTVQDFKAVAPSPLIADHSHMINAHSSISLRPTTEMHYAISPPQLNFGVYKAYLQDLNFKAVLIPAQSWWNPKIPPNKTAYVLQHEQIHFALMEIAARRLNKKLALSVNQSISGPDQKSVEEQLMKVVEEEISAAQKDILAEHTAFDEVASLRYAPQDQQEWYNKSQKELDNLAKWAR
jgi:hypothetical protein